MTSLWRRLQLFTSGTTPARRFQEEADTGVAALLMCYRRLRQDPKNSNRENAELFEQAVTATAKRNFEQQRQFVQQDILDQVKKQFEVLTQLPEPTTGPRISLSGFERSNDLTTQSDEKTDSIREVLGYSLSVETSSVPNAGDGVKLRGQLAIGSVAALFPGIVYLPEHFKKAHHLREVSDNAYARARFDSVIIDAKNESPIPSNCLAVGHKINHPPSGSSPNVMPFAFDFPPGEQFESTEFQRFIPNSFVETPSRLSMFGKRVLVHGLAFIATANIEHGEELFLNYRYNPSNPVPDWYTPVDGDSDRQMWQ